MDFKFASYGLWSEKQNILRHMLKKEFWILTNKCGNNLKHEWPIKELFHVQLKFVLIYSSDVNLGRVFRLRRETRRLQNVYKDDFVNGNPSSNIYSAICAE